MTEQPRNQPPLRSAPRTPPRRRSLSALALPLAVAGLIGGIVGGGIVGLIGWQSDWGHGGSTPTATAGSCSVTRVARDTLPSVVTIAARTASGSGTGSGVVVDLSGVSGPVVITNEHVVHPGSAAGAASLTITYADGSTASAQLLGADQPTDLAVVRATDDTHHAPAVPIGDSGSLRVGDPVVALGSPLGLASTVTSGIVSATGRYIRVPTESGSAHHLIGAIQTDAAINPGNSGGALTDCKGRLIGINAAGASPGGESGSAGLGFAIPVDLAVPTAQELAQHGTVARPELGMQLRSVTSSMSDPESQTHLMVQSVDAGGPAQRAGIRTGDILLTVDGTAIHSLDDLVQVQLHASSGDRLPVTLQRDGAEVSVTLTVG